MTSEEDTPRPVLDETFMREQPALAAHMLEGLPTEAALPLLEHCSVNGMLPVLEHLPPGRGRVLLESCSEELAAAVLERLSIPRAAALLRAMPEARRTELLEVIEEGHRTHLRLLLSKPAGSAAAMMDPRVLHLSPSMRVQEALDMLRTQQFHRRPIQSRRVLLLLDKQARPVGIVAIQDLALAEKHELLEEYLQDIPAKVRAEATREEILEVLDQHHVSSLPVVDDSGRLLGIVRQEELNAIARESAVGDIQAMYGVNRQEQALSPPVFAFLHRMPWLQVNLFTAFLAAAVVGFFEDVIAQYTALAILLPMVAAPSGNGGAQALAVVMRSLALKEIGLAHTSQVLRKELLVGLGNGLAAAVTTGLGVLIWSRSLGLMLIIVLAMICSMTLATVAGASIPLLLTKLRQDPTTSASIVLSTITDVVGFFSFLGIASLLIWML